MAGGGGSFAGPGGGTPYPGERCESACALTIESRRSGTPAPKDVSAGHVLAEHAALAAPCVTVGSSDYRGMLSLFAAAEPNAQRSELPRIRNANADTTRTQRFLRKSSFA